MSVLGKDLGCVVTENVEILRFATAWAIDGREVAEKSRKLTRIRSQGGNTPMRDKHYRDVNILVTQLAMELIRTDLLNSRDESALDMLRALEAKMETDDVARSILERMLNETEGPRQFLEELYYKGLTNGAGLKGGRAMNVLNVAENLLHTRAAIAKEATKFLTQQNLYNLQYYKMIKDKGAFRAIPYARWRFLNAPINSLFFFDCALGGFAKFDFQVRFWPAWGGSAQQGTVRSHTCTPTEIHVQTRRSGPRGS